MIEEIIPQLPKTEDRVKNAYESCSNTGKFINVKNEEFSAHLEKAKSDLKNVGADFEKQAWDWVIIKSYYAMHHAINALLIKEKGFYSKDHICAILALKFHELIPVETYNMLREINSKFSDFSGFDITYTLRKISQYDVRKWKSLSKADAESIHLVSKEIVSYVEQRCYE